MPTRFDRSPSFSESPARGLLRILLLVNIGLGPIGMVPLFAFGFAALSQYASGTGVSWLEWQSLIVLFLYSSSSVLAFWCRALWIDLPPRSRGGEFLIVGACALSGVPITFFFAHLIPSDPDLPWLTPWSGGPSNTWALIAQLSASVAGTLALCGGATRWLVQTSQASRKPPRKGGPDPHAGPH